MLWDLAKLAMWEMETEGLHAQAEGRSSPQGRAKETTSMKV